MKNLIVKNIIKVLFIVSAICSFAAMSCGCGNSKEMLDDATSFVSNDISKASEIVSNENAQLASRESEQSAILNEN